MSQTAGKLTVFFDGQFWVGLFERVDGGRLSVSRVIFGAEPKEQDILAFVNKQYAGLKFSPAVDTGIKEKKLNPKRMQRDIKKQIANAGIGTRSQQALKLQQEQNKLERRVRSREQKEAEEQRRFELRQQKKKEKHRGHR